MFRLVNTYMSCGKNCYRSISKCCKLKENEQRGRQFGDNRLLAAERTKCSFQSSGLCSIRSKDTATHKDTITHKDTVRCNDTATHKYTITHNDTVRWNNTATNKYTITHSDTVRSNYTVTQRHSKKQKHNNTVGAARNPPLTLEFPAVTVPFFLKTGGSFANCSIVMSGRGCSSALNSQGPLRDFRVILIISASKRPSFCAANNTRELRRGLRHTPDSICWRRLCLPG